ncbi:MAG TPA: amidohydrolase [Planctomycetaceae bacterium]|nr:amidohydrolase [Planctomycetaceae bacterium]
MCENSNRLFCTHRCNFCKVLIFLALVTLPALCSSQTISLQEIGEASWKQLPKVTIYVAKEVVTLNPEAPEAEAIAVVGDRILAVGSLKKLENEIGDQAYTLDRTFQDKVIVPGFIAQHDHPMLIAITMASEVLSIEDWVLPERTIRAVQDKSDFLFRLAEAESAMEKEKPLVTWGYHPSFFGKLTLSELDRVSASRPIVVLGRSCHEVVLNSAAMEVGGVTKELIDSWTPSQKSQSDFEEGRFWEQGLYGILETDVAPMLINPEKLQKGLIIARDYLHSKGITYGNEPGGILDEAIQGEVNRVFASSDMPFRWSYMVDGKTMCKKYENDKELLEASVQLGSWYSGMTSQAGEMVKLFSDGAIYSQLMQLREPYLDDHKGEWMTDLDLFQRAFRVYWDAGYQIHIHVNGDRGLDRLLDTLEENLRRNPRFDHRTTVVHFAVSAKDQVARIKKLGCIVSGNPYYVRALSDNYSEVGLGPKRANEMVRMGDVERAGISYSFHSDMPMAPADPLFLMWCGVNRITVSGRVAAPEQRVSREGALRAVTLDAAYSLKMEDELGSIESGKLANFTILDGNPVTCEPSAINEISVWGTVHEGRVLPVPEQAKRTALLPKSADELELTRVRRLNSLLQDQRLVGKWNSTSITPAASSGPNCSCRLSRIVAKCLAAQLHKEVN